MGRYVYDNENDWQYKFAFGIQDSSFGEVLEKIENGKWGYSLRLFDSEGYGEIVKLYIEDIKEFEISVNDFCLKKVEKDSSEFYDQVMMKKLLDHVKRDFCEVITDCNYTFEVEY